MLKKHTDGSVELKFIDIRDIAFIRIENRTIVYHTENDHYYHISTLSDLEEHLES